MKVKPRSKIKIRKMANNIRNIFNISKGKKIDIVRFIENVLEILNINYTIVYDDELPGEYAVFLPHENLLKIRESVYVGACNGNGRDRLTLAHEIGHIFLNHGLEATYTRENEKAPIYTDPKWQAFEFGRDLLCPLEGIKNTDDIYDISEKYGVSIQVAEIQLREKLKK